MMLRGANLRLKWAILRLKWANLGLKWADMKLKWANWRPIGGFNGQLEALMGKLEAQMA